jgi:uncharacterized protein
MQKTCGMPALSEIWIYPIKSLGGMSVPEARVTRQGLQYDRRWMLTDMDNRFMSQREIPALSLFEATLIEEGIRIQHKKNGCQEMVIPFEIVEGALETVFIWDDECAALRADASINNWFSESLGISCKLMYMPETCNRLVDPRYASHAEITSFADGYPILLIGQASLNELNTRLEQPIPMNRFRPNLVFTGGHAFEEDGMEAFEINGIDFFAVKPCARCTVTTIDQDLAIKGKEPLKTLAQYRMKDNKIYFGQNILHRGTGTLMLGDVLQVNKRKPLLFP